MRRVKRSRKKGSIVKTAEVAVAAPQRAEKAPAFWESAFAMGSQLFRANQEYVAKAAAQWLQLWATPWWLAASLPVSPPKLVAAGPAPVHKRATGNARKLARSKRR